MVATVPVSPAAATAIGSARRTSAPRCSRGKTIADVARAKGVDVTTVIDAIVTDMNSHLADAVSNGKLTQAQADEMKSQGRPSAPPTSSTARSRPAATAVPVVPVVRPRVAASERRRHQRSTS